MKKILKAIDKEIRNTVIAEAHERYDGNVEEANRLKKIIGKLLELRDSAKEVKDAS